MTQSHEAGRITGLRFRDVQPRLEWQSSRPAGLAASRSKLGRMQPLALLREGSLREGCSALDTLAPRARLEHGSFLDLLRVASIAPVYLRHSPNLPSQNSDRAEDVLGRWLSGRSFRNRECERPCQHPASRVGSPIAPKGSTSLLAVDGANVSQPPMIVQ